MDNEKRNSIALIRYAAIAPLINGLPEEYASKDAFFRAVSEKGIIWTDGRKRNFSPSGIENWYIAYKKGGFDALLPNGRSDVRKSRRIDDELAEEIKYLKHSYPRISASAIYRALIEKGSAKTSELSESTVNRFINNMMHDEKLTGNQDMRRYERPHINEVWCGDSSAGPYLKTPDGRKHRVYIIALIDDASRFVTGIDVFFNDTFINLMSVMKSAISKYGLPKFFNFDNGAAYRNRQMELLAARIGTVIRYCHPYTPTQKAKIERWFRTMKDKWMATLNMNDFHSLDELRGSLQQFVRSYNQTVHSSLNGMTPQDRFFSEPELIKRLSDDVIEKSFLLEIERRVSADSVIVIDQVEYEVDYRFAKRRITLRYSPDMNEIYVVEDDGTLVPIHLLNKHDNAFVKRDKVRLTGGDD